MHNPFRLGRRSTYPWAFAILAVLALGVLYAWQRERLSAELYLSVIGGLAAFFHFLYSQHNTNTDRFAALFLEFNARFDDLNDKLNTIATTTASDILSNEDRQVLYDYFNLCAEEYLFYDSGYIDKSVWEAWLRGMAYFASNPHIRRLWDLELKQGSYYGFNLSIVDSTKPSQAPHCTPVTANTI